jgi:hypothetical protein
MVIDTVTSTLFTLIVMGIILAPQGYVIKSVNLVDGVVIYVPIQRYIKHLGKVRISRSFLPKLTR